MYAAAKKSLVAAAAALAVTGAAGQAEACGYYYEFVTTYLTVQHPIAYYVTR